MNIPYGDPAGMRALAARTRQHADLVATAIEVVQRRTDTMAFEGPAADRIRSAFVEHVGSARAVAARLSETSDHLSQQAGILEAEIIAAKLVGG